MVDKHDFYIDISPVPVQSETKLIYRIRGNQTFSLIAVVGMISVVPLLVFFLKTSKKISGEGQAIYLLFLFILIVAGILFFLIQQKTKKLTIKGRGI